MSLNETRARDLSHLLANVRSTIRLTRAEGFILQILLVFPTAWVNTLATIALQLLQSPWLQTHSSFDFVDSSYFCPSLSLGTLGFLVVNFLSNPHLCDKCRLLTSSSPIIACHVKLSLAHHVRHIASNIVFISSSPGRCAPCRSTLSVVPFCWAESGEENGTCAPNASDLRQVNLFIVCQMGAQVLLWQG